MQNDLISRDFSVKALREYAEQKHAGGETELANGILKGVCFLDKKENVPTAYDVEKVIEHTHKIFVDELEIIEKGIPEGEEYTEEAYRMLYLNKKISDAVRNGGKE